MGGIQLSFSMILLFLTLIFFFIIGIPIAFCLGISSLVYFLIEGNIPLHGIAQKMIYAGNNFILIAIPLFILAAHIMNETGTTEKIFHFANALTRHISGGLAHVNVVASMIFAGMSGSALADVAGLGIIEIDNMTKAGYDKDFSIAVTAASSTIGPIIPPSIPFIIYGWIAGVSIAQLFAAGLIPGILMGILMMVVNYVISNQRNYPKYSRVKLRDFYQIFSQAIIPLFTPVIILGGIYLGIFTPTEAAVIATIYAIFIGIFIYHKLSYKKFLDICLKVLIDTSLAMFILSTATAFNWILTSERIPVKIAEIVFQLTDNKILMLLIINIFFLILGMFMENTAILIIFTPIMLPILTYYGISPVHFGVIFVLNIMIGLLTPPFGIVLYMISAITKVGIGRIAKALVPYYIILIITLFLVTYIPAISLTLTKFF